MKHRRAEPCPAVSIEDPDARGDGVTAALNHHLGVEVGSSSEAGAATQRLTGEGLATLTPGRRQQNRQGPESFAWRRERKAGHDSPSLRTMQPKLYCSVDADHCDPC